MAITVPAAGDAVTAAWGASVANQLNTSFPIACTADTATTSGTTVDITGLSFPVTSGYAYVFDLHLFYTVGGTSTGIAVSYTAPGANDGRMLVQTYGNASPTGVTSDWAYTEADDTQGTATTDAASVQRMIRVEGRILAAGTGTFQFQFCRNGTSTTVTVLKGSGGTVVATV